VIAVIEMSQSSLARRRHYSGGRATPDKEVGAWRDGLLRRLHRWRKEAEAAGRKIDRITVAFEAGTTASGWSVGCGRTASKRMSSTRTISPSRANIAGQRPNRLDTALLKRSFLGWCR
jgi:transposase